MQQIASLHIKAHTRIERMHTEPYSLLIDIITFLCRRLILRLGAVSDISNPNH